MSPARHPLTQAVRERLREAANQEFAPYMQAYMKSDMPYRGVKMAEQREIYRVAFKEFPPRSVEENLDIIAELWDAEYREERYAAISLALKFKKYQTLGALPSYRLMIQTGAWWDLVDTIAADLVGELLRKFSTEMKPEMESWIEDEDLWIRRAAILSVAV